jgi:cytoplasmic iron level regulating protein YaaA (DUF328/UPF0246 family)
MLDGLFIASIIGTCVQAIKEACEPTITAENWANKELYNKDMMNGVPIEQRMKNLENGKYKQVKTYPEPHRAENGKIVIENCKLYYEDVRNYGAYQAQQWVKQGKYNLNPEELKKERERYKKEMEYLYSL